MDGTFIAIIVAALVASAGVWWLIYVLPAVKRLSPATRWGVYAALWLAYFICVVFIFRRAGAMGVF